MCKSGLYFAAEPTQLADRLDVGSERNKRIKDDSCFLVRDARVFTNMRKT